MAVNEGEKKEEKETLKQPDYYLGYLWMENIKIHLIVSVPNE